jgi:hypothetical protein
VRIFFDTNVLVSAFLARGLCADLLRLVLREHTLVSSEVVLTELRDVLSRKGRLPPAQIEAMETFLRDQPIAPRPGQTLRLGLHHLPLAASQSSGLLAAAARAWLTGTLRQRSGDPPWAARECCGGVSRARQGRAGSRRWQLCRVNQPDHAPTMPSSDNGIRMRTIVDLPEAERAQLDALCRQRGLSRAEALRQALRLWLEQQKPSHGEVFGLWRDRPEGSLELQEALRQEWDAP